jgi:hypothetical protein
MRARFAALLLLALCGCGIYGPPQRTKPQTTEAPAAEGSAAAPDPNCKDPEKPQ